jgi:DNA-binding transcriptional regulator GbsR (MarR family)
MSGSSASVSLDTATSAFVEKFGMHMSTIGLPPSVARVIGLLLICEPRHQSAEAVQRQLKLSAGSVSSAMLMLQQLGLIRKVTFPEDRHFYYELDPDWLQKIMETRRSRMRQGIKIADEGLVVRKNNARLKDMRRLYQVFEECLAHLEL